MLLTVVKVFGFGWRDPAGVVVADVTVVGPGWIRRAQAARAPAGRMVRAASPLRTRAPTMAPLHPLSLRGGWGEFTSKQKAL